MLAPSVARPSWVASPPLGRLLPRSVPCLDSWRDLRDHPVRGPVSHRGNVVLVLRVLFSVAVGRSLDRCLSRSNRAARPRSLQRFQERIFWRCRNCLVEFLGASVMWGAFGSQLRLGEGCSRGMSCWLSVRMLAEQRRPCGPFGRVEMPRHNPATQLTQWEQSAGKKMCIFNTKIVEVGGTKILVVRFIFYSFLFNIPIFISIFLRRGAQTARDNWLCIETMSQRSLVR